MTSSVKQKEMRQNLTKLGVSNSATIIYDNIQKLIEGKR